MKSHVPAVLAAAIALLWPHPATTDAGTPSCTCMSPKRPTCEVWWQTSAIFVGRVTSIRTVTEDTADGKRVSRRVTLRVAERWQGVQGQRDVVVATGAGGGDCGFQFEQGETYLVYGNQSSTSGHLETGICSRTSLVDDAADDIAYLRGLATADKIVSLYGMVYRERQAAAIGDDSGAPPDPGGPMAHVDIAIEDLTAASITPVQTITSDGEGWYEFEGLSPGRYEISLRGTTIQENDRWRFRIPTGPACIWRNIIVDPLPRDGTSF